MFTFKKKYINIPNAFSFTRILLIPYLGLLSFNKQHKLFGIILIIYALTDFLDGWFARKLKISSEFGAKLDSFADDLGNTLMIFFLYFLFPFIFTDYFIQIGGIIFLYVVSNVLKIIKLKNIGLHLYSGKLSMASFLIMIIYFCLFSFNLIVLNIWSIITLIHLIEINTAILLYKPNSETRWIFDLAKKKSSVIR